MVIMQFEMSKELNDNVKHLCIDKDIPNYIHKVFAISRQFLPFDV